MAPRCTELRRAARNCAELRGQQRAPVEHEDVHRALEERDDEAAEDEALVGEEHGERPLERGHAVGAAARRRRGRAVVLAPQAGDEDEADDEEGGREVERRAVAAVVPLALAFERREGDGVGARLGEHPRADRAERVPKVHEREGVGERAAVVAARVVLAHHPRLERREEERRGDAAGDAPDHQDVVVVRVLRRARQDVQHAVQLARALAAEAVGRRARERAEDHARPEAADEEHGDVVLAEAVRRVQRVHVRALQPVRRHRDVVDQQVAVLERAKVAGRGSLRAAARARQRGDDGGDHRRHRERDGVDRELHVRLAPKANRRRSLLFSLFTLTPSTSSRAEAGLLSRVCAWRNRRELASEMQSHTAPVARRRRAAK